MRARDFREQIIKGTSAFSSFSLLNRHVVRALSSHHRLLWGFSHGPRPPSLLCLLVLSLCHIRRWLLTFLSPTYIPTSVSQLYLQRPWPRLSLAFSQLVFRESTELLMCYIPNASSLGMTSSLILPAFPIFRVFRICSHPDTVAVTSHKSMKWNPRVLTSYHASHLLPLAPGLPFWPCGFRGHGIPVVPVQESPGSVRESLVKTLTYVKWSQRINWFHFLPLVLLRTSHFYGFFEDWVINHPRY